MTVLIVGAGASKELCVPCGNELLYELISRLCTSLNYNEQGVFTKKEDGNYKEGKYKIDLVNQLLKHNVDGPLINLANYTDTSSDEGKYIHAINSFKKDLEKYNNHDCGSSIDAFLACHNKEYYQEIGKFILAYHFIGYEAQSVRESCYCNDNWLRQFLEKHFRRIVQKTKKDLGLKIITFNYERLIEHHVFDFLTNGMNLPEEQAERIIREELEVVHVYGKIADLPWQTGAERSMQFGARNDDEQFLQWAKEGIKLIGWRLNNETVKAILRIIDNGSRFFILGFGYDKDNMRILTLPSDKPIISTAYGLDSRTCKEIRKKFKLSNIEFMPKKMTCAEFVESSDFNLTN